MGILYNGCKYIFLSNDNSYKYKSLEDNIYFTLRDIFFNCIDIEICVAVNLINSTLTNNIFFEDRKEDFTYITLNQNIISTILSLFKTLRQTNLFFDCESDNIEDLQDYIEFNNWWNNFEKLKNNLETLNV